MIELEVDNLISESDRDAIEQWRRDRNQRRRVPATESIRGCMGLGVMYRQPEHLISHGGLCVFHNDQISWLALRDIPGTRFRRTGICANRPVAYATRTTASLRHGMPTIDFKRATRDSWDFALQPFSRTTIRWGRQPWHQVPVEACGDVLHATKDRREILVLNKMSESMSNFAFGAVGNRGLPLRRPWHDVKPAWVKEFKPVSSAKWFPQAYLSFSRHEIADILRMVQDSCNHTPISLKRCFTDDLAEGLPLRTTHQCVYRGRGSWGPHFLQHEFASDNPADKVRICLPRTSAVHVLPGQKLAAGELWAHGLTGQPDPGWLAGDRLWRWTHLQLACGPGNAAKLLQAAWIWHQLIMPDSLPEKVLIPSHLVSCIAHRLSPTDLYWDVSGSMAHDDWELEALIFPPLRQQRWYRNRFCMPGEVDLDGTVVDPRLPMDERSLSMRGNIFRNELPQSIAS